MTTIVFIQAHGRDGLFEAKLPPDATHDHLHHALEALEIELGDDTFIFIDEADEPLERKHQGPVPGLKHGSRVHVSRCKKIAVTVHYLEKTGEQTFPPGTRVRKVKAWAVEHFKLDHHDAAEHVLQLCNSTDRPSTDTPLQDLTDARSCSVCFDLVPEKRVEG